MLKLLLNLGKNGICTVQEAERLLAFTNNSGPLFIIGTVGIVLFGNTRNWYFIICYTFTCMH